jgi:hypothetical protein
MLFQIALVAFAVFAISKTWKQFQARKVSKHWFYVSVLFWVVVATVAITPQTTDILAQVVGVGRGADLLVYVSTVALFYVVHRLMVRQHQLTMEITELVRQAAIDRAQIQRRPSSSESTDTSVTTTTSQG